MVEYTVAKRGWYSRGYLPHRDDLELTQFVTFRLYDSVPQELLDAWKQDLRHLPRDERENRMRSTILKYIDCGAGQCFLRDDRIAQLVQDALLFFHEERYELLEWVIMPNHVHLLVDLHEDFALEDVVHSWKSFASKEANKILQRSGDFWYREYYDRWIRNEAHYNRVVDYIAFNPVKARLAVDVSEWRWSSRHCLL
ncbi:MAG: REP-associated tyrosine transposase [Fimbriimonadales bacterium]